MGRRKKRRKRKRAEERAAEKQLEQVQEEASSESGSNADNNQSSGFGFSLRRNASQDNGPQYDDEPWWAEEEEYELDDWEVKQYGEYKKMPPPMEPEHLREPEPTRKERAAAEKPGRIATIRAGLGRAVGFIRKLDWELLWLRVSVAGSKIKQIIIRFIDWVRFQNLWLSEKLSLKFRIPIYILLVVLLIGIPSVLGYFVLGATGGGGDTTQTPEPIATSVPDTVQPTAIPQQVISTSTPRPTNPPRPTATPIPPTPRPTNPPVVQPTAAPQQSTGTVASFFAPPIQYWANDVVQWSQQYAVDIHMLATALQLETCGNPLYVGAEGQLGLFGVPAERYQDGDAFNNPADSARRGAELLNECLDLSGGDNGRALVCYHYGAQILQTDFGQWPEDAQKTFLWALGIIGDAQRGTTQSAALNDWLVNGGGFDTCNQAQAALGG